MAIGGPTEVGTIAFFSCCLRHEILPSNTPYRAAMPSGKIIIRELSFQYNPKSDERIV
jgi:hypothetical protein